MKRGSNKFEPETNIPTSLRFEGGEENMGGINKFEVRKRGISKIRGDLGEIKKNNHDFRHKHFVTMIQFFSSLVISEKMREIFSGNMKMS